MRLFAGLVLVAPLFLAACGGAPPPAPAAPPAPTGPDAQGITPEEYFVARDTLKDEWSATTYVELAKLQQPGEAGAESTFFTVRGAGANLKSKFFWKSHIAAKDELKPGAVVACFTDAKKDDVFHAPATPEAARNGHWTAYHVTDVAELEKGVARVGSTKCEVSGMRVLVPAK